MTYGFGIVGCGMIANFHAKAIADIDGAELIACTSSRMESAQNFAEAQGCTAYESLDAMLADPKLDIVTICTPSGAHMSPAVSAARAGKHVIIEKPLEITLERCDAIIEACKASGVVCSTIFPSRFHKSSQVLRTAVEDKKFGQLALANAYVKWYRTQEYYDSGAWRGTWNLDGGGALMNQAIHSVDLLSWLMGDVVSITAHTATLAHERIEVEDVAVATLRFANGALGTLEASTAAFPGYLKKIELYGSKGSAVLEEEDIKVWDFADPTPADNAMLEAMKGTTETGGGAADPAAIGHHGHTEHFLDTIRAIETKTSPLIDGESGRKSVEIILAVYKAAETGAAVSLPLAKDPLLKSRQK